MLTIAAGHFITEEEMTIDGFDKFELQGGAAVMGFFLVSGFVMAIAYGDKDFTSSMNRRNFWAKRFARLAPLYYFSLGLTFAGLIHFADESLDLVPVIAVAGITTLTGTQSWLLVFGLFWNGVLWSVSTIVYFYYRLPYLMPRLRHLLGQGETHVEEYGARPLVFLAVVHAVKYLPVPLFGTVWWAWYWFVRAFPPCVIPVFLQGMIVGLRRAKRTAPAPGTEEMRYWVRRADVISLGLFIAWLLLVLLSKVNETLWMASRVAAEALVPYPFCLWLEAITMTSGQSLVDKLLRNEAVLAVGGWSYGVYVLQYWFWGDFIQGWTKPRTAFHFLFPMLGNQTYDLDIEEDHSSKYSAELFSVVWENGTAVHEYESEARNLELICDSYCFQYYEVVTVLSGLIIAGALATGFIEKPLQQWLAQKLCVEEDPHFRPPCACSTCSTSSGAVHSGYGGECRCCGCPCCACCCKLPDATTGCQIDAHKSSPDMWLVLCCQWAWPCCIPSAESTCFNLCRPEDKCGNECAECGELRAPWGRALTSRGLQWAVSLFALLAIASTYVQAFWLVLGTAFYLVFAGVYYIHVAPRFS